MEDLERKLETFRNSTYFRDTYAYNLLNTIANLPEKERQVRWQEFNAIFGDDSNCKVNHILESSLSTYLDEETLETLNLLENKVCVDINRVNNITDLVVNNEMLNIFNCDNSSITFNGIYLGISYSKNSTINAPNLYALKISGEFELNLYSETCFYVLLPPKVPMDKIFESMPNVKIISTKYCSYPIHYIKYVKFNNESREIISDNTLYIHEDYCDEVMELELTGENKTKKYSPVDIKYFYNDYVRSKFRKPIKSAANSQ